MFITTVFQWLFPEEVRGIYALLWFYGSAIVALAVGYIWWSSWSQQPVALGPVEMTNQEKELQAQALSRTSRKHRRLGLHQIWPPQSETGVHVASIDVVAIHGLETQSAVTWSAHKQKGDPSSEVHWLQDKDMLPSDIPGARIFTYDWNANVFSDAAVEDFLGHANTLLDELSQERILRQLPLVFVASCFGGLLLAKALHRASESHSEYHGILGCVVGVVFLGTPFRGTKAAEAAQIRARVAARLGGRSAENLVRDLNRRTGALDELVQVFTDLLWQTQIPTRCFYETLPTNISRYVLPRFLANQPVLRRKLILVPKASACLDGSQPLGLSVNHTMLNKYRGRNDPNFKAVGWTVKKLCDNAIETLLRRNFTNPKDIMLSAVMIFEDALGRKVGLWLHWIHTWEDFHGWLKRLFTGVRGSQKVESNEYVLQDIDEGTDVDRKQPIRTVLKPGGRIIMSMVFRVSGVVVAECPKCSSAVMEQRGTDNKCSNCGLWYRRCDESEDPSEQEDDNTLLLFERFAQAALKAGPARPSTITSQETDDAIPDFQRVRIVESTIAYFSGLSTGDIVTLEIMVIMRKMDMDIELQAGRLGALQDGRSTSIERASLDLETMKLKRLIDKRSHMFDRLRAEIDKHNESARNIINSIGR